MKSYEIIKAQANALIEFYRAHPVIAAYQLLGVELETIQAIIFRDIWFKDYVIVVACRGLGKSFLQALLAALRALLYPGHRIGLIGSSYRQAKVMFREVCALYQASEIFREATVRPPVVSTDVCEVRFKPAGGHAGSSILAIPLGSDGSKIRGQRFFTICCDEFCQIPSDIFNLVIRPMGATEHNPIENVKRIKRRKQLIELGLEVEDEISTNKIVMTSSGFFKMNHMWERMKHYWRKIDAGETTYAVHQCAYWDLPEGFLNKSNIEEAKETMPKLLFEMEYCGLMISDSEGFYKASVIESCVANQTDNYFTVKPVGNKDFRYVMAIDPARSIDSFGILIFELCGEVSKIVYAATYTNISSIETVNEIFKLRDKFNLVRIVMDSQGGGHNIKDLLEAGIDNNKPILDMLDKGNVGKEGDLILQLFNPNPTTNTDANFTALAMLEKKIMLFPGPPQYGYDEEDDLYEYIDLLKKQILSIVVTTNPNGTLSFNTQSQKAKKDLYSCFIMGAWVIKQLVKEESIEPEQEQVLSYGGIIRHRGEHPGYSESRINNFDGPVRPIMVPPLL
ncbi:MAG: terminase family protein [Chloroflexota bacterium]|nr:terminase family protein [Chloroflexota bacterium]